MSAIHWSCPVGSQTWEAGHPVQSFSPVQPPCDAQAWTLAGLDEHLCLSRQESRTITVEGVLIPEGCRQHLRGDLALLKTFIQNGDPRFEEMIEARRAGTLTQSESRTCEEAPEPPPGKTGYP